MQIIAHDPAHFAALPDCPFAEHRPAELAQGVIDTGRAAGFLD